MNVNRQFLGFDIVWGIDGCYVIKNNKLVKILRQEFSDEWSQMTGGWQKIYLEDGTMIQFGS